ncbi:MAG TPA: helix-turn-helix domain-containing protein, partial [Paraburkholderia sp.]
MSKAMPQYASPSRSTAVVSAPNGALASPTQADAKPSAGADVTRASPLLDGSTQQAGTQTLLRGLAILEAAAGGARDLRSIGAALGTTRSTTHRLVSSLVQARYLRQV